MPSEVRLFVRTSLACFVLSVLLGAAMVGARHLAGWTVPWAWVVVHTHLALVGGVVMMVAGVAFWMFPLDRRRFPDSKGRSPAVLVRTCWALLTGGLALRVVVEPLQGDRTGGPLGLLLFLAAALQAAGIVLFAVAIGPRVRSVYTP